MWKPLERVLGRIEQAGGLDRPGAALQRKLDEPLAGRAGQVLRGEPIGHPLHPVLVLLPIGTWLSASALDVTGGDAAAARRLTALGCVLALPTAAAGGAEWLRTSGESRRVGLVHAALNTVALIVYLQSWRSRRRGARATGAVLGLAGAGVLGASGWLGGHLTYARGVGVAVQSGGVTGGALRGGGAGS